MAVGNLKQQHAAMEALARALAEPLVTKGLGPSATADDRITGDEAKLIIGHAIASAHMVPKWEADARLSFVRDTAETVVREVANKASKSTLREIAAMVASTHAWMDKVQEDSKAWLDEHALRRWQIAVTELLPLICISIDRADASAVRDQSEAARPASRSP